MVENRIAIRDLNKAVTTFLIFDQINFFEGLSHSLQIFDCYALLNHSKTLVELNMQSSVDQCHNRCILF